MKRVHATLVAAIASAVHLPVHALSFDPGGGVSVDLDTTLGYDAQWRMERQDSKVLSAGGNQIVALVTDDGNRNFDKGDMIQNRVSFGSDLDINYGSGGVFLRARGWYDEVYDDRALAEQSNPILGVGTSKPFQKDGIELHRSEIELLDAFLYQSIGLGESMLDVRLGRQVVSWGESVFLGGGISSAQGPVDATKANTPSLELKDIFLPVGQVYASLDLNNSLSVSAYYQYEWEETRIDSPGTYFNLLEAFGPKAAGDIVDLPVSGAFPFEVRRDKPDEGQYGVAMRYLAESLNHTEFGLYYLNFNDFMPSIQFAPSQGLGSYATLEHFEDVKLIGASFGTVFGDTNVSGEVNFRNGQPVRLNGFHPDGQAFYYSEADTLQAQVSAVHIFGSSAFWDNLVLLAEVAHNRVLDLDKDGFAQNNLDLDLSDISSALHGDRSASSAIARLSADYFTVASGLDLNVSLTYRDDFNGVSAVPFTFVEGNRVAGLTADFIYTGGHSFGAGYTWFLTSPTDILEDKGRLELEHLNADRDYASLYYKYRF
ncbi:DUF1302 family protein [Marinobacter sp. tcs-11]|uniref:DUF1302 domain-containing protein n=1 Tax=Marinobacter sp. tcs-11 TaxID=1742860 RepID=UPI00257F20D9|nr:DUF1302 family protein [Marinobacter sp. tcs-11]